jgi:hypothetical protein
VLSKLLVPFLFLMLIFPKLVKAQILDDSTKNVYGPSTTRYALENDVFNNRETLYTVDTLLDGFQNYNFLQRNGNLYQDLGNLGTAIRPIFFTPSQKIGAMLGMDVYTPYALDPEHIKYYNTRSPFSSLYYVQGGNGIQLLDVEHSRNINSRWNVGFRYQRPTAPKQFAAGNISPSQNRQVDSHEFALYSWYKNLDSTYQILANLTVMEHRVLDQGSILPSDNKNRIIPLDSLFLVDQERLANVFNGNTQAAILTNAHSRDSRNQIHFYQQYAPVPAFQLYHVFDRQQRLNYYRDLDVTNSLKNNFYPEPLFTPTTEQETKYLLYENKIGIKGTFTKGRLNGFNYRFHARRRDYSLTSNFIQNNLKRSENFVGGWLNYYFPDSSKFFVEAEYMPGGTNDYRIRAEYQSKFLTGGIYRINQSPTLIQQNFLSNHYDWNHSESAIFGATFKNFSSDNIYGQLNVRLGGLLVLPSIHISNLDNYIYFDTQATPKQENNSFRIVRMGLGIQYRLGNFQTVNQAYYTTTTNPGVLRMPELFANSRIAYNILFKKVLYIQVGVDLHYKSAYKADAYMPLTQQFHLQDKLEIPGYLLADAFATFRVQRVRLFFKMGHANQGFMSQPGYFTTPVYTGLPRSFAFGVNWLLFD